MKTILTHLNRNNHGFKQPIPRKQSSRNSKYVQNTNKMSEDVNRNSTISQAEYERDACEQELYRLRYGIEKLLADNNQRDFTQRQRFRHMENPSRTMTDFNNRENQSWLEQCADCYRHERRDIYDDNLDLQNESPYHHPPHNDRNYDSYSRKIPQTPRQPSVYSDSFASPSRSPSRTRGYSNPNMINDTDNDLRRSIDSLINQNTPDRRDITNFLTSNGLNDPVYNSLILKILEAKALDCLCTGYSKQNTQKQISQALAQLNQRTDGQPWDSVSATSSRSPSVSYESSPSVSSYLTENESTSSSSIISPSYSPSPSIIYTPNTIPSPVSSVINKADIIDTLKVHDDAQTPKKQSKVTIVEENLSQSDQSAKKKKSSSKHHKKSSSKHAKPSSSKHHKTSQSKHRTKSTTTAKKPHQSKKSHKHQSSSKSKKHKSSSRSPSKSKTSKSHKSKQHKSSKKKGTKPKSNNQINDYESIKLPTFIYPQSYQYVYKTRQQLLKLLLTSR